ncbi:MAG TPA: BNR-4 repeat-containing protein [Bacillota bacterium]|nr:BNR-4 repeat-containing protein [Bacillota bacterium]
MRKRIWTILLGIVLILCFIPGSINVIAAPGITKTQETTVTSSASSLVLTDYYLNGCSYQQDAISTYNGWQYTAYYNSSRQVCVARRQLPSGSWQILTLTDYTQSTNDAHNTISLGIAPGNGTLHLAFDHHDATLHYRKSTTGVATNPGSINWSASLFGAVTSQLVSGTSITGLTYPRFVATPQGDLQFEARLGSSGNGQDYLWEYKCSTGAWTSLGLYISNPNGGNAYINGIHYDNSGRLHVTWVKRDTPDATTNHDLHYIFSTDNGRTWRNNSGSAIGTTGSDPVTIEEPKFWTIPTNSGLINQEAQTIDSQGRVHLLMRKTVNGTNYQFHYWRGTDGVWHETNTNIPTKNWYQRGKIVAGPNDNLYAVMPDLIIGSASASTNWTDWAVVNRTDENKYHSEPLVDYNRLYKGDGILSVVYQMESSGTLKVLDYQLGTSNPTATPTPTRAATATPTVRVTPTPTTRILPSVTMRVFTPTPTTRVSTPTPTVRPGTPTPTSSGGYVVAYIISSDWGNGATINLTITNKTTTAINGWTLAWIFPGNQTITNLWNGIYTQSGASVSVKDAGFNGAIGASGGSVNFGYNINYSSSNAKPNAFTLNGTACQVQ